jgi:hypothetical protein
LPELLTFHLPATFIQQLTIKHPVR